MFTDFTVEQIRRLFSHHLNKPKLKPLKKSCHDCAVTCGLYAPYSEALNRLPKEEIEYHSQRWKCHNNTKRACAGNIKFQEIKANG